MHVVIVGAGFAGLFAAAAASAAGHEVTLLERDLLDDEAGEAAGGGDGAAFRPRPGAPQGAHPHVLLHSGLSAGERLLPGLRQDLLAAGGVPIDTGDLAWLAAQGWFPIGRPAYELVSATRPLMEAVVRRRVLELPRVRLRSGARVDALTRGEGAGPSWSVHLADRTRERGDLVVDASGRSSRLATWLRANHVAAAPSTVVDAGVGYATQRYVLAADALGPVAAVVLQLSPDNPVGGLALPVEGGHWLVGAQGCAGRRPGRDAAALAAHLRSLADPVLAELAGAARPVGGVAVHRQTGNVRHHYERLRDWPDGLLVVGDALCAFNPVYGQGISVAARQAVLLRQALDRADGAPPSARALLRRMQHAADLPWSVATGMDRRYPGAAVTPPSLPQRAMSWWTDELSTLAAHGYAPAQDVTSRVYQLVGSPVELFAPRLLGAAARDRLRGRPPAVPRPPLEVRAR